MQTSPQRRALVIGIDKYKNFPAYPLLGCVNDAQAVATLLESHFGFDPVTRVLDEQATETAIRAAFRALIAATGADDEVVVFYAGHGSQRCEENGRMVETIVPTDSGREDDQPNRDIPDTTVFGWLRELTAKTPYVTLLFDSCHAAGITRSRSELAAIPTSVRHLPPDLRATAAQMRPPLAVPDPSPLPKESLSYREALYKGKHLPPGERFTLIAACRAEEHACEMSELAPPRGAFSYFLCQQLAQIGDEPVSYRQLYEPVCAAVAAHFGEKQHPEIEGSWDRRLLARETLEAFRFVPVYERRDDRVLLGAGFAAADVVPGSEWRIYPRGLRVRPEDGEGALGRVRVEKVGVVDAVARVLEEIEPGAVSALTRAYEVSRPEGSGGRLKIRVPTSEKLLAALIASSPLLEVAEEEAECDVAIRRLEPEPNPTDPAKIFRDGKQLRNVPRWGAEPFAGPQIKGEYPLQAGDGLLVADLEKRARLRALDRLENGDPDHCLRDAVHLSVRRQSRRGGPWTHLAEDGAEALEVGDQLTISVAHQASQPLYLSVFGLGAGGGITVYYPPRGAYHHAVNAGEVLHVISEDDPIELFLPEGVGDEGREVYKVVATTARVDLGILKQDSLGQGAVFRGGRIDQEDLSGATPLDRLLVTAGTGQSFREGRRPLGTKSEWTTCQQAFRLRRAPKSL
jgi:hypothetical protein